MNKWLASIFIILTGACNTTYARVVYDDAKHETLHTITGHDAAVTGGIRFQKKGIAYTQTVDSVECIGERVEYGGDYTCFTLSAGELHKDHNGTVTNLTDKLLETPINVLFGDYSKQIQQRELAIEAELTTIKCFPAQEGNNNSIDKCVVFFRYDIMDWNLRTNVLLRTQGGYFETTDGGNTWEAIRLNNGNYGAIYAVSCITESLCYGTGSAAIIVKGSILDRETKWQIISSHTSLSGDNLVMLNCPSSQSNPLKHYCFYNTTRLGKNLKFLEIDINKPGTHSFNNLITTSGTLNSYPTSLFGDTDKNGLTDDDLAYFKAGAINDIHCFNNDECFAVGDNGTIFKGQLETPLPKNENNRKRWKFVTSHITDNFKYTALGLAARPNRDTTEKLTNFRTSDGRFPDFNQIYCDNNDLCMITGELGIILFTSDRGETWELRQPVESFVDNSSSFGDSYHGVDCARDLCKIGGTNGEVTTLEFPVIAKMAINSSVSFPTTTQEITATLAMENNGTSAGHVDVLIRGFALNGSTACNVRLKLTDSNDITSEITNENWRNHSKANDMSGLKRNYFKNTFGSVNNNDPALLERLTIPVSNEPITFMLSLTAVNDSCTVGNIGVDILNTVGDIKLTHWGTSSIPSQSTDSNMSFVKQRGKMAEMLFRAVPSDQCTESTIFISNFLKGSLANSEDPVQNNITKQFLENNNVQALELNSNSQNEVQVIFNEDMAQIIFGFPEGVPSDQGLFNTKLESEIPANCDEQEIQLAFDVL